jgi:hypothetical protein
MKPQLILEAVKASLEDMDGEKTMAGAATLRLAAAALIRQASDLLDAADRLEGEETPW